MKKITLLEKCLVFLAFGITASNVWSFGEGGGYSAKCNEPKFKNIKPQKIITPGGEFSFTASENTEPASIKVTIKGQKIALDVKEHYGIQVKGNMPPELTEGYALIKITAYSNPVSCDKEQAWLVKIVP